ncbi:MAG: hydantoinase/oxoprolinase family protein [Anaerolineales bacterium]|nr:hydantoinase/oxoprolinase family protein [Anaerolineales bacterium]
MTPDTSLRIGVDIGGTFTDFVVYRPGTGEMQTFKLLSTPHDPAEAVLSGLARIHKTLRVSENPKGLDIPQIIHGSTVATNALLERKGARTALVATRGFGDVLQIGRQERPELYDFSADPPPPLIPEALRFEVDERVVASGQVLQALDPAQVEALLPALQAAGVESVAVCLLFSFLRPEHERQIAGRLREAGLLVSSSSEVLPEYREYERASTTAVNAYVSPVLDGYLAHLEAGLPAGTPLRVMQSNGGVISVDEARRFGVRCILSGPAGGVVGAQYVGQLAQSARLITFDMGGTSTDVSLIDGAPQVASEAQIGGCPIRVPVLDIHTIGAGGGSIARLDAGGALRVGPQSAGADPGPACYGRGELPTVTDANLVLGRLAGEYFLGGEMPLDTGRALRALEQLGSQMGLDPMQAALGVVEVANAHMERALRVISVERGHDPRRFSLLSFGGAGGLHAADLARRLATPRVLAPPLASTLSAFGMLAADVVKDYTQTVMLPGDTPPDEIAALLAPLAERGRREVVAEGIPPEDVRLERLLDVRYRGQSYELTLPFSQGLAAGFHALHQRAYGYQRPDAPLEIVNLRLRAVGRVQSPVIPAQAAGDGDPAQALLEYRQVIFPEGALRLPLYRSERLQPGDRFTGPALVVRADTTILVGPPDRAQVDPYGNLIITIGKS